MELILIWVVSIISFSIPFLVYMITMRHFGENKEWNVNIDPEYEPTLTIIIPTYNEEKVIARRLENLLNVDYPRNKLQFIHVDSASTDSTLSISTKFFEMHPEIDMKIIEEKIRSGKGKALNNALIYAKNDVIVTSDADSFFYPDSLRKIVKYLVDQKVAAVTGKELLINPDQSSLTRMESTYLNVMFNIKLGESKLDSMIIFQGEFSAYKKHLITKFEDSEGGDDSPTALDLVQKGYRTLFAPDAIFYDATPSTFEGKSTIKIRRAQHQILLWLRCLNLLIKGKLKLNHWIAFGEILFFVINPILFLISIVLTILVMFYYPILLLIFIAGIPLFIFQIVRNTIQGYIIGNLTLLIALARIISGDKNIIWKKVDETRSVRDPFDQT